MQTQTVVATFNDYSSASQAARELESIGVPSGSVAIDSNRMTAGAGSQTHQAGRVSSVGFLIVVEQSFWLRQQQHDERRRYEGALAKGGTVLRATVDSDAVDRTVDVLNRYGAVNIEEESSARNNTFEETQTRTGAGMARAAENAPLQVVEEELQVGKRAVQRGGVRVYSHLVSTPVEEQVRLREEHVNVERRPVNREISPEEISALRDQTIEVTEMAEEPVVSKRARVREEVVIGKDSTERTETIRDNVRHTEVEVEDLENSFAPEPCQRHGGS